MTWFETCVVAALFSMCSIFSYHVGYNLVGALLGGFVVGTILGQLLAMLFIK